MFIAFIILVIASIISFFIGKYLGKVAKFDPKDASKISKGINDTYTIAVPLSIISVFVSIWYNWTLLATPILIGIIGFTFGQYDSVSKHPNVRISY